MAVEIRVCSGAVRMIRGKIERLKLHPNLFWRWKTQAEGELDVGDCSQLVRKQDHQIGWLHEFPTIVAEGSRKFRLQWQVEKIVLNFGEVKLNLLDFDAIEVGPHLTARPDE